MLTGHSNSIDQHEQTLSEAEHYIAECERSLHPEISAKDRNLAEERKEESQQQTQLREAHEEIKRHHHGMMAKLGPLVEALGNNG